MKCPVCGKEMVTENFGCAVDVCQRGCHGIWFDQGELTRLDETSEGAGRALEAALRDPRDNQGKRGPINCPKCSLPLHTHRYKRAKEVNVDECYNCAGFFLDSGELTEIRDHYMSDAEIDAYADQLLKSIPQYVEERKNLEIAKRRLAAIQKVTSFLTMNYWRRMFS